MSTPDEVIAELRSATGWRNISFKNDYFVFDMTITDIRVVKGMKNGDNCLYLDFESFNELPIMFCVRAGETVHQYWTRGKHLHRTGGKPAYVSYDPTVDRIIRRWHWNGILHRTDGPAKEMIAGLSIEEVSGHNFMQQESWDHMYLEWYTEGFPARFPWVKSASLSNGHRYRDKRSGMLHSPRPDLIAFHVDEANFEWSPAGDGFQPSKATIHDLTERYDQGKFVDRGSSLVDFSWYRGDKELGMNETTKFNEEIRGTELLSIINLWGELYEDDDAEFLLLTEFERIGRDEGVD